MELFSLPDQQKITGWENELRNHNGQSCVGEIVQYCGIHYRVRHSPNGDVKKLELLCYFLGKQFANIAEVKQLTNEDIRTISTLREWPNPELQSSNTVLVRVAQDYALEELLHKELDLAVAGELVFSTLVRRRDAHEFNRAYVGGIPVFFDHHASLLFERECQDINIFFGKPGKGYAGSWRVRELSDGENPNILSLRADPNWGGTHLVKNTENFRKRAKDLALLIKSSELQIGELAQRAGFEHPQLEEIVDFLRFTTSSIKEDTDKMLAVVLQLFDKTQKPTPGVG